MTTTSNQFLYFDSLDSDEWMNNRSKVIRIKKKAYAKTRSNIRQTFKQARELKRLTHPASSD